MEHIYPDCDLITLADGRVLGISKEYIMLYDDMDDFYNCDPSNKPTIDLWGWHDYLFIANRVCNFLFNDVLNRGLKWRQQYINVYVGILRTIHHAKGGGVYVTIHKKGAKMNITLEKVASIVAEQRRDTAYQVVLQAQRELLRYEHEYVASLKALDNLTINEGA